MISWIRRLATLQFNYPDPAEQRQAQRLLVVNLTWIALILVTLPIMIWWVVDNANIDLVTMFVPFTLAISLLNHQLLQRGQVRWARSLFILNVLVFSLLGVFPDYRIDTPFILALTLPLTAAGMLLGRSGLLSVAGIIILSVLVGGIVQAGTGMEATPMGLTAEEAIRGTIIIAVGITILNTVFLRTFGSSIEDSLRQQHILARLTSVTAQTSRLLASLTGSQEDLNQAVEQIRDAFGLYHVQVYIADPASGMTVLQASTGFVGRRLLEEESLLTPDERSPINDALRQTDPIMIPENASEDRRTGFLPATRSELLIPLRVGNLMPIGVLDLHSTSPNAFSARVLEVLMTVGNHLAVTLYSAQQARDLRTSYQERDRLSEQLETGQRELARLNRQLIGTTWGAYLGERRDTVPGFDWHNGDIVPAAEDSGSDMLIQTLQDGQPHLEQRDGEYVLCVPIRLRGQILGAVEFRRASAAGWSSYALELAHAVAERLALSLENARLFEQAQTTAQREQLVSEVTSQLQTARDLQTLLNMAAVQFQDALGATHTRVRLGNLPTDPAAK